MSARVTVVAPPPDKNIRAILFNLKGTILLVVILVEVLAADEHLAMIL